MITPVQAKELMLIMGCIYTGASSKGAVAHYVGVHLFSLLRVRNAYFTHHPMSTRLNLRYSLISLYHVRNHAAAFLFPSHRAQASYYYGLFMML